ncbi:MAG: response regulator transcription factor [Cyanobacteria bacterium CAN_BIN43]|nr:response regulator transcription factor [Cyanobacteria bacterium CAN_BIN43]
MQQNLTMAKSQAKSQKMIVVDDHEAVLNGTVSVLKQQYPEAEILTAQTVEGVQQLIAQTQPDVVVVDLSIPATSGDPSRIENGIQLLRTLMQQYPHLNIAVQSAHSQALVRLKPAIHTHKGGFTIADKSLPLKEMLIKVDWAMQGVIYTPQDMRTRLELKSEWLEVLRLAFCEGLQDKAIAEQLHVSERTVRHYWTQVQDALSVYPEPSKNIRIQTELRARELGLVD